MVDFISNFMIPAVILLIILAAYIKGVPVFDVFVEGAKIGAKTSFNILPVMVGIIMAVSVLNASGLIDILTSLIAKPLSLIGIPPETIPVLLIRPFSGSASLGMFSELIKKYGADSYIGRVLSTIMGSSETVLYTLAVYFGAANVKNTRHAIAASLISSYLGMLTAIYICKIL
ncbi:MAG: spore maturation protein [Clostridiaceae bacterium]|nr:spore maturation protein [Clostridiaceae bacterium]